MSKTQRQHHFAQSVHADIQRSTFFRNSTLKTTFNAGELIPIYVDEVVPGDTFEMDMDFIARLTTPIFPTMDVLDLDFYAFFVANRLAWDGWEALMGENKTGPWIPAQKPALTPVTFYGGMLTRGTVGDYYGLPVNLNLAEYGAHINALPIRGYYMIYNEWFRDQNLQAPLVVYKSNEPGIGPNLLLNSYPLKVNKKHDYFTSCLPAPQKGESALIPIELNELIPVITGHPNTHVPHTGNALAFRTTSNTTQSAPTQLFYDGNGKTVGRISGDSSILPDPRHQLYPSNLWADGRGMVINSTTISELRTAFQIQKLYERDARGGTRYVEMLKAHFGVDAQDYRLQRPEFLGHCHSYVGIQQVPQTSATGISGSQSPQGNLAAFSYTAGQKNFFKKSFVEHGYIHIFAVARHPKTYQQGIERFWFRRDRLDYYVPVLAHISEQPVYTREIYALGNTFSDQIFGYQEAWADYRYKPNRVTGQMRSGVAGSRDNWHYADNYSAAPLLSAGWIEDNSKTNVDRTLAISSSTSDQIMMDIAFKCTATRPMPVHSIPGLVDHF